MSRYFFMQKRGDKRRWVDATCSLPNGIPQLLESSFKDSYYNKAITMVSRIYNSYLQNDLALSDSYEIPSNYYKKVLSGKFRTIWKEIIDLGILIQTGPYSTKNNKCKAYKFSQEYYNTNTIEVRYKETERPLSKLEKDVINILELVNLEEGRSPEDIVDLLKDDYIDKVKSRIDSNNRLYINKLKITKIECDIELFIQNKVISMRLRDIHALRQIVSKSFISSRNETNSRLDHTLTNCSNRIFKYLTFKGEKFVSIDLSCSQLCLFTNICLWAMQYVVFDMDFNNLEENLMKKAKEDIEKVINSLIKATDLRPGFNQNITEDKTTSLKTTKQKNKEIKEINNGNNIKYIDTHLNDPYPKMCSTKTEYNKNEKLFFKSALNGNLYEDICEKLNLRDRNEGKLAAFKLIFGWMVGSWQIDKEAEEEIKSIGYKFREAFPKIFEIINDIKYQYVDELNKREVNRIKNGSRKFPIFLQRAESFIFIDNLLPKLLESNIHCLTKHDSILVPYSEYEKALEIIVTELQKYLPYGFNLKIESEGMETIYKQYSNETLDEILDTLFKSSFSQVA